MLKLFTKPSSDYRYCAGCGQPLDRKLTPLRFDRFTGLPIRQRVALKCPHHDADGVLVNNGHDSFEWTENVGGSN